jgi:hypothetical protein
MISDLVAAQTEIRNIYKVGLNTTRLLMALGDIICAWLLLRQAEVGLNKIGGDPGQDQDFYQGKVAAAQFFAQHNLPKLTGERVVLEATNLDLMSLDEFAF